MPRTLTATDELHALMANPTGAIRGPNGRRCCKWCGTEVSGRRTVWCSDKCVDEMLVRVSQSHVRRVAWKRDKGICAQCGMDCTKLKRAIRGMSHTLRREVVRILGIPHYRRGTLWHADHIVPVVEGGGKLGVSNIRTLCWWDHRAVTVKLHRKRLNERRKTG